jgi:hypothetical protein
MASGTRLGQQLATHQSGTPHGVQLASCLLSILLYEEAGQAASPLHSNQHVQHWAVGAQITIREQACQHGTHQMLCTEGSYFSAAMPIKNTKECSGIGWILSSLCRAGAGTDLNMHQHRTWF